jgi:manganese oxidase
MNGSVRTRLGIPRLTPLLALVALGLIAVPVVIAVNPPDPLAGLPPANEGAFEGGPTGTAADEGINNALPPALQRRSNKVPSNARPSPLFGAEPFTQKLLLFEEFGTAPLPASYLVESPLPPAQSNQLGPDGPALDSFLAQPMYPEPGRMADESTPNPWRARIEQFLGRPLNTSCAEGRPPGEGWAHQRWDEFPPRVAAQTATAGARVNNGLRDLYQRHGYAAGEFGASGLYHETTDSAASAGTASGIRPRFHPAMPDQHPNALWTFDGTFPPKLMVARYGETVLFRHYNALPIDPTANFGFGIHTLSTHEHNGHTPAESDGFTNSFFFPGQYYDYVWPLQLAGHDTVNTTATDPRAGAPDGSGGITKIPGDWRETMSTHWFHDHMLEFTAQNVYKGCAAMMNYYSALDRGNEAIDDGVNLRLPSGTALDWGNRDYDVNLVVADKAWTGDGQLWFNIFNLDGFLGDRLLTNWQWQPYLDVRARRYRFRILNGSVSRFLKIALIDDTGAAVPFHLVANDGNIMEHSVAFDGTLGTERGILPEQGIAERYDIVVDFSQFAPGRRLYFVNLLEHENGRAPKREVPLRDVVSGRYHPTARDDNRDGILDRWVSGDPCVGKFLELRVNAYAGTDQSMNPADYVAGRNVMIPVPRPDASELAAATHRTFEFGRSGGSDSQPWTVKTDGGHGLTMDPRRISAGPDLGALSSQGLGHIEIWHIKNGGNGWSHPVHVHFEEGMILTRNRRPPPEWERWARKDVYRIGPFRDSGRELEIAIRFREFAGTYMEHCHNTQHEDHSMLLRWDIMRPGQLSLLPTPIPSWDGCELVPSVALPTISTGDGVGPVR